MPHKTSTQNSDNLSRCVIRSHTNLQVCRTASMAKKQKKMPRSGGCEYRQRHKNRLPLTSKPWLNASNSQCILTTNRTNSNTEKTIFLKLSAKIFGTGFFSGGCSLLFLKVILSRVISWELWTSLGRTGCLLVYNLMEKSFIVF